MAILLNDPGCNAGKVGNTATPSCAINPDLITGFMLVPKDKVFTSADVPTFITDVRTLCTAGIATRVFPFFGIINMDDKTPEISMKESGYGGKTPGPDPRRNWVFKHDAGGLLHQLSLRKFNKSHGYSVMWFDQNNRVWCTKTSTAGEITGISLEYFLAHPVKWASGKDAPAEYMIEFGMSKPIEMNENLVSFNLGANPEDSFQGLRDVELYDLGVTGTTKHHYIGVRDADTKVSLYGAFSTALVYSLFTATLAGVASNPTAITPVASLDGGNGGWDLTFPATGAHTVSLATPAVLAAAHVGEQPSNGFEATGTIVLIVV